MQGGFDGITMGVLSTPVIDGGASGSTSRAVKINTSGGCMPSISRAVSSFLDGLWKSTGRRWSLKIRISLTPVSAPGRADPKRGNQVLRAQRGALNLSPDGALLYVTFGESSPGWLAALDTQTPKLLSSFSGTASMLTRAGGIWGRRVAVDDRGNVFVAAGTTFKCAGRRTHNWAQSILQFSSDAGHLTLRGSYTPFIIVKRPTRTSTLGRRRDASAES